MGKQYLIKGMNGFTVISTDDFDHVNHVVMSIIRSIMGQIQGEIVLSDLFCTHSYMVMPRIVNKPQLYMLWVA